MRKRKSAARAVKQHEQIRTTIRDLTLKALQMRDLSLEQINSVVRNITAGVNIGVGDGKSPYERNAAISWHFERDPIPYALETGRLGRQESNCRISNDAERLLNSLRRPTDGPNPPFR